jgi:hypothetical protein
VIKKLSTTSAKSRRSRGSKKTLRYFFGALIFCILGGVFLWQQKIFDQLGQEGIRVVDSDLLEKPEPLLLEEKRVEVPERIRTDFPEIPFYVQAPLAQWQDPIFQNACEEASMLMVADALQQKTRTTEEVTQEIKSIAAWQEKNIGTSVDTNAQAVAKTLEEYFGIVSVTVEENLTEERIRELLTEKAVVLVPLNGQKLANPHFTWPGPQTHMLVIFDYNPEKNTFVTHDPGTKFGSSYEYKAETLFQALGDYPTGNHLSYQEPLLKSGVVVWNHSDPLQN